MRLLIAGVLGVLLGVLVGRFGPAQEVSQLKAELSERAEKGDCGNQTLGRDLAVLMGSGMQGPARNSEPDLAEAEFQDAEIEEMLAQAEQEAEVLEEDVEKEIREALSDDEELDALRAALGLRRSQARAALIEDADPSGQQLAEIDEAVADMNASLESLAQDLVEMFEDGNEPGRRDAMVFAAEALDTMIAAEDHIWDALDADQRSDVEDASIDPFSYVDQALVGVLAALGESH